MQHELLLKRDNRMQWNSDVPEAFAVLGFAFYVQPMLMPLLHEMPAGQLGVRLMCRAVRVVTLGACVKLTPSPLPVAQFNIGQRWLAHCVHRAWLCIGYCKCALDGCLPAGVAVLVYGLVGVFGAARFGAATAGDILVNTWLGGRAEGVMDAAVVAYLAISMPPVQASIVLLHVTLAPTAPADDPDALIFHYLKWLPCDYTHV